MMEAVTLILNLWTSGKVAGWLSHVKDETAHRQNV